MCLDSYNRDILRCKCGNIMVYVDSYNPLEKITYKKKKKKKKEKKGAPQKTPGKEKPPLIK